MKSRDWQNALRMDGIREYGLGKFHTYVDRYVWEVSLSGADSSETVGWTTYDLLRHGRTVWTDEDPDMTTLTDDEKELIRSSAGMIVSETEQGFVHVEYFDSTSELDEAWEEVSRLAQAEGTEVYGGR